ncbi:glutathione S-transferase N-terminal domain-containing protein [Pseudomonas sp. 2FE]|uniref:glutathione S-transferase N-terminal domain-containing protein n=1 Tax=Pseudomonas sp. 2FE TaxID=2502190 RepID=UPI0010F6AEED|nr:glutathione S-transferase N-terminal domain-containing protein [Pseudomonas sp. 2FE]
MRELYELCGAEPELVFSPYCWRVRLALLHKGLSFVSRPLRFTDKAQLAFSGQPLVPVLRDGEAVVSDSLAIFRYLDQRYPAKPLLGDALSSARLGLIDQLIQHSLPAGLFKALVLRIHAVIDPADHAYFRQSREQKLGLPLEEFADPVAGQASLQQALPPLNRLLATQAYLDGSAPAAADYLVAGFFFWAWSLGEQPWDSDSPVGAWFQRLLGQYEAQLGPVKRAA